MENSGQVLFQDDTPEWYVAVGESWLGPLAAADVYSKILNQELTWAHFVWRQGEKEWKRICDTKTFRVAVPEAPATKMMSAIKEAAKPSAKKSPPPVPAEETRTWFLYYNATQFGPFSDGEIRRAIQSGKIHGRVHAWKEGMAGWERLERIAAYADSLSKLPKKKPTAVKEVGTNTAIRAFGRVEGEQRETPRAPLLAKILFASHPPSGGSSGAAVTVAMCRDISVGGMQVLTDRIPGQVGSRIKMNVSATSNLDPFVAEGVIVRILEDKRGFSFRFEKLSDAARRAVETYIASVSPNAG